MKDAHRQMDHTTSIVSTDHTSGILSIINQFHREGEYWDVRVQVDTKVFKCQRSILAANSEYFDTLFRNAGHRDSNVTADQIITLPKKDAIAFEMILNFMYTGVICVKDSDILHLFVLSDFLRLRDGCFKELMVELVRERSQEMGPMSCTLDLLRYAYDEGEDVLLHIMSAHVCRRLYYFSEQPQLMDFSFKHLNALLKYTENFIVPLRGSADVLVKIIYNWVNYDRDRRSQYRCKLMENVDLENVSSNFALLLTNRRENALDVFRPFSESETLGVTLEVIRSGEAGLWGIIPLTVPHVSKLSKGAEIFSSTCTISNLLWEISLERSTGDDVAVYLCCEGTDSASEWSVYAEAIFLIESHKEGVKDLSYEIGPYLFLSSDPSPSGWGLTSFLPWSELIDPENGYITEEDSITIIALVHADVPFFSYNPQCKIYDD